MDIRTFLATVSNRRNFYRLRQVQPDAAPEVIKGVYRALMAMHHPDKGGDHVTASLMTNAYATLSDPRLRSLYDAQRVQRKVRDSTARSADGAASRTAEIPSAHSRKCPRADCRSPRNAAACCASSNPAGPCCMPA